tara:strand:+ start:5204 stop:5728 length:525 start_codon:yes stop_codon:yes gene_type:complete
MNLEPANKISTDIQVILGQKLIQLGRNASGQLINSFTHQIIPQGEFNFLIKIMGDYYWRYVEYGVSGDNIPYDASQRSGANNSKYIDGLINWIKVKGIASDNDVVRGIAFAIAYKQTAKGGLGFGNPINKNKLGFVEKSKSQIDNEVIKLSGIYNAEIKRLISSAFPNNIEITF